MKAITKVSILVCMIFGFISSVSAQDENIFVSAPSGGMFKGEWGISFISKSDVNGCDIIYENFRFKDLGDKSENVFYYKSEGDCKSFKKDKNNAGVFSYKNTLFFQKDVYTAAEKDPKYNSFFQAMPKKFINFTNEQKLEYFREKYEEYKK
ncbi:MAG: hypothetical protein ACEPOV_05940 [Hyphomicrobiales bacterium]